MLLLNKMKMKSSEEESGRMFTDCDEIKLFIIKLECIMYKIWSCRESMITRPCRSTHSRLPEAQMFIF